MQSPGSIAFEIGPLAIYWYGVLIAMGIFAAYGYVLMEASRRKLPASPFHDLVFWAVVGGLIGARLYYVAFQWPYYMANLGEIAAIWKGGLAIHGALLGGFIAVFLVLRKHKGSILQYADILAPGVIFAQAVGRWGNFFNSEAFGRPTDASLSVYIPPQFRPPGFEEFSNFHPTFLYESVWNLAVFVLLVIFSRRKNLPQGSILALYIIFYSIGRFFIESLRMDSLMFFGFRTAQIMSIILILAGILFFVLKFKNSGNNNEKNQRA